MMNMHVNQDGSAFNGVPSTPFEQAKSIAPCILGQLIIDRRVPSKYGFLIGNNFLGNPEPFNAVYDEQLTTMSKTVPEAISKSPMFLHQVLCRSIEIAFFTIACQLCKDMESVNYLEKVKETKPYEKAIAAAYAEKIIDEEFAAEMTKIFESMGDGFNVHCAVTFEYPEYRYSEETFYQVCQKIIIDTKNQKEHEAQMKAQQEAFAQMLNAQPDGSPMDKDAFEKALKEAGFAPANIEETEGEPIGEMVDVDTLEEPTEEPNKP